MVCNGRALQNVQMYKLNMVLDVHPYAITAPSKTGGRWQTYVKEGDKRKIIRASSKEKLMDKLYTAYFVQNGVSGMTMDKLFLEWLAYKECITNSMNTIRRHEQHWKKYFQDISPNKVSSYDRLELQKECNQLIKVNNLSSKEWQNVKTILLGMFDYAFEKGYINTNPMPSIKITVKFRQVNKKSGRTETYQTDEYKALMQYLDAEYTATEDLALLAVKFDFFIGCRVAELVALKWCDVENLRHLHICREEVKESVRVGDTWKDVYTVSEHTKTYTDRSINLVPNAIAILNHIRLKMAYNVSDDDYIFTRNGSRITSRQINYILEKACTKLGIMIKRSHKVRKTFASRLNVGEVPLDSIRELLGHANLSTTLSYIYNPLSEKETYNLMSRALGKVQ